MFCRNCGKEIPSGTNFCNHCGAAQNNSSAQDTQSFYQTNEAQHSSMNSQPVYAEPRPPKKKSKGPLRFIIPIAVVTAAFVIGYFATGANKVKAPTAFDTPDSFEFNESETPSENQAETESSGTVEEKQCKTFIVESDISRTYVKFFYGADEIVRTVEGAITVYDTTKVDTTYLDDLRQDAETATNLLTEMGASDSSYVFVSDDTGNHEYSETYMFASLEEYPYLAELTAQFIGFEAQDGKIMIESAEEAMLGFGFTLQ